MLVKYWAPWPGYVHDIFIFADEICYNMLHPFDDIW